MRFHFARFLAYQAPSRGNSGHFSIVKCNCRIRKAIFFLSFHLCAFKENDQLYPSKFSSEVFGHLAHSSNSSCSQFNYRWCYWWKLWKASTKVKKYLLWRFGSHTGASLAKWNLKCQIYLAPWLAYFDVFATASSPTRRDFVIPSTSSVDRLIHGNKAFCKVLHRFKLIDCLSMVFL